jgi:DNA polymerase-3 subunit alpha
LPYIYPRIDLELLRRHREGLIVLSGCLGGEIAEDLRGGGYERALETARRYKAAVEPGSYFLEVQPNGLRDQIELNAALAKIGHVLDIPRVVTCDCHYLKKVHARAQDTLMAIQTRSNKEDKERLTHGEMHSLYLWTEGELRAQGFGEEAENAGRVAAMVDPCSVPKAKVMLPKRDGNVADLARRGLRAALDKGQLKAAPAADYHERLEYELSVIGKTGFEGYFLIVADFCDHARRVKIPVGPGRGSGAGSLVARCLGITGLDPLAHGLLFERFLNPERVSMPDFDIDFDDSRREEMIEYLRETYGRDAVGVAVGSWPGVPVAGGSWPDPTGAVLLVSLTVGGSCGGGGGLPTGAGGDIVERSSSR